MRFDDQWLRINQETNEDGEPVKPLFARNVRTDGGMIVGRIVKLNGRLVLQRYKHGEFVEEGTFDTFDDLHRHLLKE